MDDELKSQIEELNQLLNIMGGIVSNQCNLELWAVFRDVFAIGKSMSVYAELQNATSEAIVHIKKGDMH